MRDCHYCVYNIDDNSMRCDEVKRFSLNYGGCEYFTRVVCEAEELDAMQAREVQPKVTTCYECENYSSVWAYGLCARYGVVMKWVISGNRCPNYATKQIS